MRPSATRIVSLVMIVGLLVSQSGCQSGAGRASVLSLFGLSQRPLVIALVAEPGVLNPFAPYEKLRQALSASIKRPRWTGIWFWTNTCRRFEKSKRPRSTIACSNNA